MNGMNGSSERARVVGGEKRNEARTMCVQLERDGLIQQAFAETDDESDEPTHCMWVCPR